MIQKVPHLPVLGPLAQLLCTSPSVIGGQLVLESDQLEGRLEHLVSVEADVEAGDGPVLLDLQELDHGISLQLAEGVGLLFPQFSPGESMGAQCILGASVPGVEELSPLLHFDAVLKPDDGNLYWLVVLEAVGLDVDSVEVGLE